MKRPHNSYCTIYLIRHGETEGNVAGMVNGQSDSKLTEKGVYEAQILVERLKEIQFDAIFSSDLLRAVKTAEIIRHHRLLPIVQKKSLRERTHGILDGIHSDEYTKKTEHLLETFMSLSTEDKWRFMFSEGYESDEVVVTRLMKGLHEIAVEYVGKTVLAVSHGGVLRTFLTRLGFAAYGELKPGTLKNLGIIRIKSDGTHFILEKVEGVNKTQGIERNML